MNSKQIVFLFVFFITGFCFSQKRISTPRIKIVHQNKNLETPPGTTYLNDSLFIDVSPISNLMLKEFLDSVEEFWSIRVSDSIKTLPNFGVTKKMMKSKFKGITTNELLLSLVYPPKVSLIEDISFERYLKHPKYKYYPTLNLTKEQAQLYCKWRTDMVKLLVSYQFENVKSRNNFPINFIYRLPTKKEYLLAIEKFGYSDSQLTKNAYFSFGYFDFEFNKAYKGKAYFSNTNISEYTLDSNPFGENWRNSQDFSNFNDYTGFRCVCEIID